MDCRFSRLGPEPAFALNLLHIQSLRSALTGGQRDRRQDEPPFDGALVTGASDPLALLFGGPLALQGGQILRRRPFFLLPGSDLFRSRRLPHLGRLILTAGDNPLAVRGKGHRPNPTAVPLEREQFPAAGRLPHLGRLIVTAGDNPLAVRGKGHRPNPSAVPLEREQFPAAGRVPHLGRLIPTAGDNPLAVRGKGHRRNPSAVPLEREQFPAAGRLPHLGRLILTAGDNPLAVRGKGHRP